MPRSCPQCDALLPEASGYPEWCDACGWNLEPPTTLDSPGVDAYRDGLYYG